MSAKKLSKSTKDASANSGCAASTGSPDVEHRKAWEKNFITPIAKTMKQQGVAYMVIIIRDDGKAAYVLDTEVPENVPALPTASANL